MPCSPFFEPGPPRKPRPVVPSGMFLAGVILELAPVPYLAAGTLRIEDAVADPIGVNRALAAHSAEGAERLIWPAGIDVGGVGGGCQNRIVLVHSQRRFVGERPTYAACKLIVAVTCRCIAKFIW